MRSIDDFASVLGEDFDGIKDIRYLFNLLDGYQLSQYIVFDPSVVRGLAYYTGIVFEGFDRKGELRAIFGGGRYDSLLDTLGGKPIPAVGFGFGDAVIAELIKLKGLQPELKCSEVDIIVYPMDMDQRSSASKIAQTLRAAGHNVDLILDKRKPKWVFQRASKIQSRFVIMIAADELKNGQVILKDIEKGEQILVDMNMVVESIKDKS